MSGVDVLADPCGHMINHSLRLHVIVRDRDPEARLEAGNLTAARDGE